MEITKYLKAFEAEACPCGKKHILTVSKIIAEKGAIAKLPEILKERQYTKPFLLS